MARAEKTDSKRAKSPSRSFFKSAPAHIMAPRLMVGLSTFALVVLGLVMVYSSSSITAFVEQGDSTGEAIKQCAFVIVGLIFSVLAILFGKHEVLRGFGGTVFWAICVALLVLTALLGTVGLGAKRWLIIGPISIQISEFAKIAFVLMAARIAEDFREGAIDLYTAAKQAFVYIVLPLGFLFGAQSDLGTTLICCVGLVVVIALSGASGRLIAGIFVTGIVLVLIAILISSYRSDRLFNFLDPWADEQGTGYQLIHSYKALAAGGLFGVGIGNSYEKLQYLPEAETDFIFAIIGEELGLVGALLVVCAFLVFLRGGFLIASQSKSMFSGLVAAGLTTMIVFQAFLNILCVIGLFPTTGKPLPFISSGGSSMISSLLLVGIVLAISFDSHNEDEYRQRRESLHVVSTYSQPQRQGSTVRDSAPRLSQTAHPYRGGALQNSFHVIGGKSSRGGAKAENALQSSMHEQSSYSSYRNSAYGGSPVSTSAYAMESRFHRVSRR